MAKIISLTAENVKRLKAVRIEPDGSLVVIGGENAQGKSSVLDSIWYALGGAAGIPGQPVRRGAKKARIELDLEGVGGLEDLKVIRTFTAAGGTSLSVFAKDGAKYPTPQKILDKLVGALTFDPLEFTKLNPKEQRQTLLRIAGIDPEQLDIERKKLYDERTEVNRELRHVEAVIPPAPTWSEYPTVKVSVFDLAEQLNEAILNNKKMGELKTDIDEYKDEIDLLRQRIEAQERTIKDYNTKIAATTDELSKMASIDISEIKNRMATAESNNALVDKRTKYETAQEEAKRLQEGAELLTARLQSIEDRRVKMLQEAEVPVDGLGFSDEGVTFNGLPFEQASHAETLRVSVAMAMSLNPELNVCLIRDGSLLDAESFALLAEYADEAGAQIWVERVSTGKECFVVIEDGEVKDNEEGEKEHGD